MSRPPQPRHDLPIVALVAIAFGTAPTVAHAYIDPGTAGFVVTTVLGFLAAGGYVVRGYLGRLKRRVFGGHRKTEDGGGPDVTDGRTDDREAQG